MGAALALGIMLATVALLLGWAVVFYLHLTADDRRYRKNLRKGKYL